MIAAAILGRERSSQTASEQTFFGVCALICILSAAVTMRWCISMSAMGGPPMPGGWTLSMAWTRMCGQTWVNAAGSFLGMWLTMMLAMMLPSLLPMLIRYRVALRRADPAQLDRLTAIVIVGYFIVWGLFGMAVFPIGVALAAIEMQVPELARCVPIAVGAVVLIAGAMQLTAWKAHQLACSREVPTPASICKSASGGAWQAGLRLGVHCCRCCANLTAILLVVGVMDISAMALVTAAITAERIVPAGKRAARIVGVAVIGAGVLMIARAVWIG